MADPFSVTGSAVGVVSLAIQVCKGLEWYLSGVKEAKDKAEQIAAETEELANLLERLETVIGKVDPSQSVSAARTGIVSCASAIATIRKKLKPDDQANGGIKSNLKRLTKRLAFPFKEADIKYWKDVLNTIQQSLQTALLALVIDQQRLASGDVQLRFTQLSMNQSAQHYASLQLQRDGFDSTSLQLAGQSHMLESGFSATSHSLQRVHDGMLSLEAKLDEISLMDSTLDTDFMNLRSLQRKERKLKQRYARLSCTCRPQTSAVGYRSGLLALTSTRTSMHDPGCPQAPLQNAVTKLQLQATLCSVILRKKVSLSLKLTYGAGLSVQQNLECYRVVSESSPAFAFVGSLVQSSREMPQEMFRGEVGKLFMMFELRQATCHDRLANGETLLHALCDCISRVKKPSSHIDLAENLRHLFKMLLPQMAAEAFETNDEGLTCMDYLWNNSYRGGSQIRKSLLGTLFELNLQITRHTVGKIAKESGDGLTVFDGMWFEPFSNPVLDDSELLDAILLRNDRQLRYCLHQSRDEQTLDSQTVARALLMATISDWIDGCRILLQANLMAYLNDGDINILSSARWSLLAFSAVTARLDMPQFWLSQREKYDGQQLHVIGHIQDVLDSSGTFKSGSHTIDFIRLLTNHFVKERREISLLMEKHGVKICCDGAQNSLPDAHVRCMLTALVREGVYVPQHYWPNRRSLYYIPPRLMKERLQLLRALEEVGFCDISEESFKRCKETNCSPLVYLATQVIFKTEAGQLTHRDLIVRWFLSKGADLRETWPGTNTTALHCLAWQSAAHVRFRRIGSASTDPPTMETSWAYENFEFLSKEGILDSCECACSGAGCGFLSCFWKEMFELGGYAQHEQFPISCESFENANLARNDGLLQGDNSGTLLIVTLWVDKAAHALNLPRLIHGYIRLFVFSYLEMEHTCCEMNRVQHWDNWEDPDYTEKPYPRYSPKVLRRINEEDAHLRARLEELVPELISQYDSVGGQLQDFVIDVLIPTMRRTAKELKEEDKTLYAAGRREMGVVMIEDEDETEEEEDDAEEEEVDVEEESDDEY